MSDSSQGTSNSYKNAGVDIDLAHTLLDRVKGKISSTRRPEALSPIGGFGGMFRIDLSKYRKPVMVTSIDGVGTKLIVATMMDRHDTVGYDIVNHCINDVIVQGAEPVYFTDYIGIGALRSPLYENVLEGLANACAAQNVTLIGGETAEMPGMYGEHYDLVGCITGIVDEDRIVTGEKVCSGHVAIGLPSSGLHTNGFSLARKVLFETARLQAGTELPELGCSVGDALLKPHVCYWPVVRSILEAGISLDGMAHITGGGLYDNVPRILSAGVSVVFDAQVMPVPPIFSLIREAGDVDPYEMYRVFNMGIGMVLFVPSDAVDTTLACCSNAGFADARTIGRVIDGDGTVTIENVV